MRKFRFNDFELRPDERVLSQAGHLVGLGARAFDLLACLVDHRDRVVSKAELLD